VEGDGIAVTSVAAELLGETKGTINEGLYELTKRASKRERKRAKKKREERFRLKPSESSQSRSG
jgi:hypothetical protein